MSATTSNLTGSHERFSPHTLEKAAKTKVSLQSFYSNLLAQHKDRKSRYFNKFLQRYIASTDDADGRLYASLYTRIFNFNRLYCLEAAMEEQGLTAQEVSIY